MKPPPVTMLLKAPPPPSICPLPYIVMSRSNIHGGGDLGLTFGLAALNAEPRLLDYQQIHPSDITFNITLSHTPDIAINTNLLVTVIQCSTRYM